MIEGINDLATLKPELADEWSSKNDPLKPTMVTTGSHRFIELARAAGATYKINEGTGGTVLVNLEIFDNYMEQFRQPVRPLKEPLYGQEEGELNE